MDSGIAHDFSLHSMLNSSHDDYDNFTSMPDNDDHFTDLSASPPPLSNHYIDEFTGTLNKRKITSLLEAKNAKIWKEMPHESPYHPPKPVSSHDSSNVLVVVDKNSQEEYEAETEPFDYSIFLNKPSSPPAKDDDELVPIEGEREEVVVEESVVSESEKVSELPKQNPALHGNNTWPVPGKKDDGYFHCELCSSKFNRRANYKRHRLIHFVKSKKIPYRFQCQVCGRNFLQRCDLVRHMHVHNDTHPFKCDLCGKGYLRKKDLEIHMGFHLGEKNYRCGQCTKSFFSNGDLCRHIRTSHCTEEKLRCGHCCRIFSRESTLLQHMQKKHSEMILGAFKEQVYKLKQMPAVVKINMVPFKVNTMASPDATETVTSTSTDATSLVECVTSSLVPPTSAVCSSAAVVRSLTSSSPCALNLSLGSNVTTTSSAVTLSETVMTLPVRVDDVTSLEAKTESSFS